MRDSKPIIIEHKHGKAAFRRGTVHAITYGQHGAGIFLRVAVQGQLAMWTLEWMHSETEARREAARLLIEDMGGEIDD